MVASGLVYPAAVMTRRRKRKIIPKLHSLTMVGRLCGKHFTSHLEFISRNFSLQIQEIGLQK